MPANGAGTWGDRSAILGGGAVIVAGRDLRRKIIRAASILLEAREEVLDIQDGYVFSRQVPQDRLSVAEIAEAVFSDVEGFAGELQDGLTSTRRYEYPKRRASANGAHAAIVEVDVETGKVHIKRYICVEDVGRAINPTVVEGQIRGCVAQGLGGALLEQIAYDESGQLLTSSFLDYLLPEATDVPDIEVHLYENPSPDTLGGFKNAGEGGICGAISATSNAIADALAPFNIRINRLPLKPDRILEMMGRISHAS
ncbi:MAG: xanthine dehydrogenase family protein molybdopterin-binding subunit, partial [Dehalococcoidia bacterium]